MGKMPMLRSPRCRRLYRMHLSHLALFALFCAVLSCKQPSEPPLTPTKGADSHQQMLDHLAALKSSTPATHPYLNTRNLTILRNRSKNLTEATPPLQKWRHFYQLGLAEQSHGDDQAATAALESALSILKNHPGLADPQASHLTLFQTGMAWLRLGESQNCCARELPEACILPLAPAALHTETEGSTKAIAYFTELAEATPRRSPLHLRARWLMNIAALTLGQHPDAVPPRYQISSDAFAPEADFPRFSNQAQALGLDRFSLSGGVVADDFNNDEHQDLLVSGYAPDEQLRLYLNDGAGGFEEVTEKANLTGLFGGLNMVQADYDNDGHLDVLILRGAWFQETGKDHPNSLLRNNGDLTFSDVTFSAGLGEQHFPTQTAAWADFDLDGDLDLYIGNETSPARGKKPAVIAPSQLFRNNGDGTFSNIAASAGVTNDRFAKAVTWGDIDHDRYPDLFVSNHFEPNRLYRNNGDGTFTDIAAQAGVSEPIRSFPAWFWDYDNDGHLDLYVSGYAEPAIEHVAAAAMRNSWRAPHQRLYRGDGRGGFSDETELANLRHPHAPMGANFGDLNGDGYLDFYLGTGHPNYWELMPNVMYRNEKGRRFENVTFSGGFGHLQKGHGIAFADFDNDGDQDVFAQMGGAVAGDKFRDAYFQNPGFGTAWIKVTATGTTSNRSAIGTKITVHLEGGRKIVRWVGSGGSFGANPLTQHFGLGGTAENPPKIDRLELFWPASNQTQTITAPKANTHHQVTEPPGSPEN